MTCDMRGWVHRYAEALGVTAPSEADIDALLELAGTAAHASERPAAPLSCWLAERARMTPSEALAVAQELAESLDVAT